MKRFQLMLDEETFDLFKKYFWGHGVRQTALRQAVKDLVKKAQKRHINTGEVIFDIDDLKLLED